MKDLPTLSSEGLRLFPLRPEVVSETYVKWLNDPVVNRYLESRFARHTLASTRAFVEATCADEHAAMFGIDVDGRHVGNIKLAPIERRHGRAEIGLLIGEPVAWGRGIATRAIRVVSDFAFRTLSLRKLTAGCYSSNVGSVRAFERAGFAVEAVRTRHYVVDDGFEDLILLARFA